MNRNNRTCLCILMILTTAGSFAQVRTDCDRHFFKDGKLSTAACYENGKSFGHALAYDKQGHIIYDKEIRKVGGHSYVLFGHYTSGAVKRAEWHSAPDAGLQWYSSITTFDQDGKVLSYTENNYDDHTTTVRVLKKPPVQTKTKELPKKPEVAECAVIFTSEMWFINNAPYPVTVHADRLHRKTENFKATIMPGNTAQCGYLILAQQFANPHSYFSARQRATIRPGTRASLFCMMHR